MYSHRKAHCVIIKGLLFPPLRRLEKPQPQQALLGQHRLPSQHSDRLLLQPLLRPLASPQPLLQLLGSQLPHRHLVSPHRLQHSVKHRLHQPLVSLQHLRHLDRLQPLASLLLLRPRHSVSLLRPHLLSDNQLLPRLRPSVHRRLQLLLPRSVRVALLAVRVL